MEEFIAGPNHAQLLIVGQRCQDMKMFEAAKILFNNQSNFAQLAITLCNMNNYKEAVEIARKANSTNTWKEICFSCIDNKEFALAQACGMNIVVHADELEDLMSHYHKNGNYLANIILIV